MSPGAPFEEVRCRSCGGSLAADSTFCVFCGAAVTPALGLRCSDCGRPLDPNVRFCPDCGSPADGPSRSPEAQPVTTTQAAPPPPAEAVAPSPVQDTPPPTPPSLPPDVMLEDVVRDAHAAEEDEAATVDAPLETPSIYVERPDSHIPPPAPTGPRASKAPLVAIGALALAVAAGAAIFLTSTKRTILRMAAAGNLVQPEGNSAYDRFLAYNATHPAPADVAEIAAAVSPALERRGNEIITKLQQENIDAEADWAEASRIYAWLQTLRPSPSYESRQYFSQARLRFLKGENSSAIGDFQRSIQLDGSWALPWNGLARVFLRMQDRQAAQQHYRRATEVEPNWIFPWLNLGTLSYELKDYAVAELALRRALALDPTRASAHYYLARSLDDGKHYCDAIREYATAIDNVFRTNRPGFSVDAARNRREKLSARYSCK